MLYLAAILLPASFLILRSASKSHLQPNNIIWMLSWQLFLIWLIQLSMWL
jgi:hypothetical protein